MADRKISELTALTTPASGDYLPIVDVSEAAAADKNKRITVGELLRGAPDGTAAAPGFAFESDNDNGMFRSGTNAVGFSTAGNQRVTIDSSGRLLVGTTSSRSVATVSSHIQVEGTAANDSSLSLIRNSASSSQARLLFAKSRGAALGSNTVVQNDDFLGEITFAGADGTDLLSVGATIVARVDGTPGSNDMPGRLAFSTTADGASSPTERMRLDNRGQLMLQSTTSTFDVATTQAAGTSYSTIFSRHSSTSGSPGTGTVSFRVYSNGNVVNTNNSYGAISDVKLKENIVDASSQWDDIKGLRVRNYNFIEGQTHTQIGLVAQEAELVSPGLVSESPDRDEEGNDLGTVTKSVNYSVLYMKAVKALQEAMERIETLEAKVAALESA